MTRRVGGCLVGLAVVVGVQVACPDIAVADSVRDAQWHLPFLKISEAHSIANGNGISVAIVDSGVDARHPDLIGSVVSGSEVNGSGDGRSDSDGHGTSMAGLVAARGHGPSAGALGVAPGSAIIPIKIPNHDPLSVAAGIDQATNRGAGVICLALETSGSQELEAAVARAQAANIIVVAAAGNRPAVGIQAPAKYAGVVAAVGVDRNSARAEVSVTGTEATLAAPAEEIASTALAGGYVKGTGTSASAAIVAGVAALVRSKFPELAANEVVHRMTATAIDKGLPGRDREFGFGIVNPVAALTAEVATAPSGHATGTDSSRPPGGLSTPSGDASGPLVGFAVLLAGIVVVVAVVTILGRRARK